MKQFKFIVLLGIISLFMSCNKSDVEEEDIGYVQSLSGEYSINCKFNYPNPAGGVYFIMDTTFVGSVTSITHNILSVELFDGTLVETKFRPDEYVAVRCLHDGSFAASGIWFVTDSSKQFHFRLYDNECYNGYKEYPNMMDIKGIKL